MAEKDSALRFQELFELFLKDMKKLYESFSNLQRATARYASELDQRSKELDAKIERLEQLENTYSELQETPASSRLKVDKRSVGIQAG